MHYDFPFAGQDELNAPLEFEHDLLRCIAIDQFRKVEDFRISEVYITKFFFDRIIELEIVTAHHDLQGAVLGVNIEHDFVTDLLWKL